MGAWPLWSDGQRISRRRNQTWLDRTPACRRTRFCHPQSPNAARMHIKLQFQAATYTVSPLQQEDVLLSKSQTTDLPASVEATNQYYDAGIVWSTDRRKLGAACATMRKTRTTPLFCLRRGPPEIGPRGPPWWAHPPPSENTSAAKDHTNSALMHNVPSIKCDPICGG